MKSTIRSFTFVCLMTLVCFAQVDPRVQAEIAAQVDGDATSAIRLLRRAIAKAEAKDVSGLEQRLVALLVRQGRVEEARALAAKLTADQGPSGAWAERWLQALNLGRPDTSPGDPIMSLLKILETNGLGDPAGQQARALLDALDASSDPLLAKAIPKLNFLGLTGAITVVQERLKRPNFAPLIRELCESDDVIKRQCAANWLSSFGFNNVSPLLGFLLEHKDLGMVDAALQFLTGVGDEYKKARIKHEVSILAGARRCFASPDDGKKWTALTVIEFEFPNLQKQREEFLLEIMKGEDGKEYGRDAVGVWFKQKRKQNQLKDVNAFYSTSPAWLKIEIFDLIGPGDMILADIVRDGLTRKDLVDAATGAALVLGLHLSDEVLLKKFMAQSDPNNRLGSIANVKGNMGDALAQEILKNVFTIESKTRVTNPTITKILEKRLVDHIDFVLERNPQVLWQEAGRLLNTRAWPRIVELGQQGENEVLCRSLLEASKDVVFSNYMLSNDYFEHLRLATACATKANFLDFVVFNSRVLRNRSVYPSVTKWCLDRIRGIVTPKDLESYLQFLDTSKLQRAWVSHKTICWTLKKMGLGKETNALIIRRFVDKNIGDATKHRYFPGLLDLLGRYDKSSEPYLWKLINENDGVVEEAAFQGLKTKYEEDDGFLDLHMRALGNSQCDAVFLSQDQRLKENKEYQTLLFEQWIQRGSKKKAALGLMDLRFIPQERLIAVLMSILAAKDVDKCYAILVEMFNAGISLGDGAFLPFFAQVIEYRDSKSAIESLQELAVEGLSQQFSIESLKILVEALRLSDRDNAKAAKAAIEKIRLYLREKAALLEMEINQKLIEAGRRTK